MSDRKTEEAKANADRAVARRDKRIAELEREVVREREEARCIRGDVVLANGRAQLCESALSAILDAARDGNYWAARKWLDERDIYNGDLSGAAVIHAVASTALAQAKGEAFRRVKRCHRPRCSSTWACRGCGGLFCEHLVAFKDGDYASCANCQRAAITKAEGRHG
jgi:hypothetical protein